MRWIRSEGGELVNLEHIGSININGSEDEAQVKAWEPGVDNPNAWTLHSGTWADCETWLHFLAQRLEVMPDVALSDG